MKYLLQPLTGTWDLPQDLAGVIKPFMSSSQSANPESPSVWNLWTSIYWWVQWRCRLIPSLLWFSGESYWLWICYITSGRDINPEGKNCRTGSPRKSKLQKKGKAVSEKFSLTNTAMNLLALLTMRQKERHPFPTKYQAHFCFVTVAKTQWSTLLATPFWGLLAFPLDCISSLPDIIGCALKTSFQAKKEALLVFLQINLEKIFFFHFLL